MIQLLERLSDRLLGMVVPSVTAHAAICYGNVVGGCKWVCCNTTCTVEKRCCYTELGVCVCSACEHS